MFCCKYFDGHFLHNRIAFRRSRPISEREGMLSHPNVHPSFTTKQRIAIFLSSNSNVLPQLDTCRLPIP